MDYGWILYSFAIFTYDSKGMQYNAHILSLSYSYSYRLVWSSVPLKGKITTASPE
jgi:hypothetical protein